MLIQSSATKTSAAAEARRAIRSAEQSSLIAAQASAIAVPHDMMAMALAGRLDHDERTWSDAHERWTAAVGAKSSLDAEIDEAGADAADDAADNALWDLLHLRAPTAEAMAEKARIAIDHLLVEEGSPTARADNPAYLADRMSRGWGNGWAESALIALFQDASHLSGGDPVIAAVRPQEFEPREWLVQVAKDHNVHAAYELNKPYAERVTFNGPGADLATAAFNDLPEWRQEKISDFLEKQAFHRSVDREGQRKSPWSKPCEAQSMIRTLTAMIANYAEPDSKAERATLCRELRDAVRNIVGLPVGPEGFDPSAFVSEVYAAGCRFDINGPLFGPELLRPASANDRLVDLENHFCALDTQQIDQLYAHLLRRERWAAGWITDVETLTGCTVTFQVSGIGFDVSEAGEGCLTEIETLLGQLTSEERSDLKAFAQARADGEKLGVEQTPC